ncbi:MAG: Hpt domain-containing protein, partial [Gammaproteobacteria bacterium]|nr:Hpt domain-containing protein [Gammaproteobacteria bacterium]
MNTIPRIDPGTLGWVRTEIDENLKHAAAKLEVFAANTNDVTPLRSFSSDLHQVFGTLQMVELDGASGLAQETEALSQAMQRHEVEGSSDNLDLIRFGLATLREHLDRLQLGRPDVPLRLVPELNRLRAGRQAEPLTEFELFNPDVSIYPPPLSEEGARERLNDEAFRLQAREVRRDYQAALLHWLREPNQTDSLQQLADSLSMLENASRFAAVRQVWWIAGAYVEGLLDDGIAPTNEHKTLLGRIDQQVRRLVDEGEAALIREPPESLIKALLFAIGNADSAGARVAEVKDSFELQALLGIEAQPAEAADERVEAFASELREFGDAARSNIEQAQLLLARYFSPHGRALAVLEALCEALHSIHEMAQQRELTALCDVVAELESAAVSLTDTPEIDFNRASLYMAAALLFLENSIDGHYLREEEWRNRAEKSVRSLRSFLVDTELSDLDETEISPDWTSAELRQLLSVVAGETRVNLANVEHALEGFSKDLGNTEVLQAVPTYLDQVQGALDILGQRRAAEMVAVASQSIREIQVRQLEATPEVIDALAVAVGSAEAYVEGLEQDRSNLDTLIDRAMREMDASIAGRRIEHIDVGVIIADMRLQLDAWLEDPADTPAFRGLRQGLRDIGALADARDEVRMSRIVSELNNLLDVVTDDIAYLSEEVIAVLHRSLATLSRLCEQFVTNQLAFSTSPETIGEEPAGSEGGIGIQQDEIMEIFLDEVRGALRDVTRYHNDWADNEHDTVALRDLRRQFHTLKGSGRLAGATQIAELSWITENLLNKVIRTDLTASPA